MILADEHRVQKALIIWKSLTVRCTTFLKVLEIESEGDVCATNDTLPNYSYHYDDQLSKLLEFEMHAFPKMTGFLVFSFFYFGKQ